MVKGYVIGSVLTWNNVRRTTMCTCCRLLFILYIGSIMPVCRAACPTENLPEVALRCFENYGAQKLNLDKSSQRLFSGIDVETLRAYCSSFLQGMMCLTKLSSECPENKQRQIEVGLSPLHGVEQELSQLCRTDRLYELYAQYMTCFLDRGNKSDWCFRTRLDHTKQSIYKLPEDQLCSRMRNTTRCIEKNVKNQCGERAAELVHKLVMPLVQGSGQCVYSLHYQEETTSRRIPTTARKGGTYRTAQKSGETAGKRDTSRDNDANSSASHYHNLFITIFLFHISYLLKRGLYS